MIIKRGVVWLVWWRRKEEDTKEAEMRARSGKLESELGKVVVSMCCEGVFFWINLMWI